MKIEKIKNYNQIMLSVVCTLGAILLSIGLIMVIFDLVRSRGGGYDEPQGLIADEKTEVLNQENLRKQVISYETPWLIDTLKSKYIIPVSVQTLKKPEDIVPLDEGLLGLMDMYPTSHIKSSKYSYYRELRGKFTNLIIYDALTGKTQPLFDTRALIGDTKAYYFQDDILLLFYAAATDTDKNGVIDLNDVRSLYIYSLNNDVMQKISDGDNSIVDYRFMNNSKDLIVEISLGAYKKEQFLTNMVPNKMKKYNFDSQKLSEIIPEKVQAEMQRLVEGK